MVFVEYGISDVLHVVFQYCIKFILFNMYYFYIEICILYKNYRLILVIQAM
jgi:hypothetical protein